MLAVSFRIMFGGSKCCPRKQGGQAVNNHRPGDGTHLRSHAQNEALCCCQYRTQSFAKTFALKRRCGIMKQKEVEYMKAKVLLSAFASFFFGLIGYFVLLLLDIDQPFQLAVLSGLLFALLLFPVLIVYEQVINKRYKRFEKEILSPVFLKVNGNFYLGGSDVKNGNIYFCEDGIVCICLEDKPYTKDKILLQNIDHFRYTPTQLSVFTNDERIFVITLPQTDHIIDMLIQKGWILPR